MPVHSLYSPRRGPGLSAIIDEIARQHPLGLTCQLAVELHRQRVYVAGTYAHLYFEEFGPHPVEDVAYQDVAELNAYDIAALISAVLGLDRADQLGTARTLCYLVDNARKLMEHAEAG